MSNRVAVALLVACGVLAGVACGADDDVSATETPTITATVAMVASDGPLDGTPGPDPTPTATQSPATPTPTQPAESPTPTPTTPATVSPTPWYHSTVTVVVRGDDDAGHEVIAEVVYTPDARQIGLMYREEMAESHGMLFLFPSDRQGGFWMRNTLIPLDIAYFAADGTIVDIKRGEPLDETVLTPQAPYRYVLEMNAGWFEDRGLGVGDTVELPGGLPPAE